MERTYGIFANTPAARELTVEPWRQFEGGRGSHHKSLCTTFFNGLPVLSTEHRQKILLSAVALRASFQPSLCLNHFETPSAPIGCTESPTRTRSSPLLSSFECAPSRPLSSSPRARFWSSFRSFSVAQEAAPSVSAAGAETPAAGNIVDVLRERDLVDAITNETALREAAASSSLKVYLGFDPTAESLHIGHLLGIVILAWFQKCGHTPVAVLGGATARVGDPSGKSIERPVMSNETIERNLAGLEGTLRKLLRFEEGPQPLVVNNYDWHSQFSFLDFLRDVGRHARVGVMIKKDSVQTRLASEEGMSFTEFCYQLLQGYDFVHLFKEHGVTLQLGGSDQWGNITAGTDLVRKMLKKEGAMGLTFPLLLQSDGRKFGKSEGGAVWLSEKLLSPYKFYQYLFAVPDADVVTFLKRLTFLDVREIAEIEAGMRRPGYQPNTAQRRLAEEVTRFVHGDEGLAQALAATQGLAPGAATKLDISALEAIAADIPSVSLPIDKVEGQVIVDVFVAAGLFPSKGAVRRQIKNGGAYLNNEKVEDEGLSVTAKDVLDGRMLLLASGKKNKLLVKIES
ncbi:Tyrosyl-tRNA synthetase [Klebsormidium nitens]|uniref:Tyrosine--tRNA ligase n=1 Tax=Klebsormidium nitens TaxID=105231 RepID=A0A1Y1HZZ5_KLENI|nr:Tyrosyl-tRNA synthetase [Klebsormidium nitens]|eukprot:GAQ84234.1 Tyrosyl-tRNA synthetase [Klebsormidium nitens]